MTPATRNRATVLGDLRAEFDRQMLKFAFLETADYKTLTTQRIALSSLVAAGRARAHWYTGFKSTGTAPAALTPLQCPPTESRSLGSERSCQSSTARSTR
jgi:hypothetical protein